MALFDACRNGNLNNVKCLIGEGINFNEKDKHGQTCLFTTCYHGKLDIVKYLIEELGLSVNEIDKYGQTCLFLACSGGRVDVVKYLVEEKQLDINKRNNDSNRCLSSACLGINDSLGVIEYLLKNNIIVDDDILEWINDSLNENLKKVFTLYMLPL